MLDDYCKVYALMLISKVSNLCVSNYNGRRNIPFIRIPELITHNKKCSAFINSERCVYVTLLTAASVERFYSVL